MVRDKKIVYGTRTRRSKTNTNQFDDIPLPVNGVKRYKVNKNCDPEYIRLVKIKEKEIDIKNKYEEK